MTTHGETNPDNADSGVGDSSPYAANPYVDATLVQPSAKQPTLLTPLLVIVLSLAILGSLTSLAAIATKAFMPTFQQKIIDSAKANPESEQLQLQAEMQLKSQQATRQYTIPSYAVYVPTMLACLGLVVGSILTLRRSPTGRKILMGALLAIVVCDIGKTVLTYLEQVAVFGVMQETMPKAIQNDPNVPEETAKQAGKFMSVFMDVGRIVAVVMMGGWFLMKAFLYLYTFVYLKKPEIAALFAATDKANLGGNEATI